MNMNYRIVSALALMLFLIHPVLSQAEESYEQELPGTGLSILMKSVPTGTFQMGSPSDEPGRSPDEGPVRTIGVEGFWISAYEVTWDLYNLFLQQSIVEMVTEQRGKEVNMDVDAISGATIPYVDMSLGMGTGEGLPVVNVTQLAASKFCEWLSAITGHFYRLPTEAEWEYAARAGEETSYFFGEDPSLLDKYAWFEGNSGRTYKKVGLKAPNPWGLYDIYGNVAELTLDQYYDDAYTKEEVYNPTTTEYPVVVRGGSFKDQGDRLRSASRLASDPVWKQRDPQFPRSKWWHTDAGFVGFRILRPKTVPPVKEFSKYWRQEN